MSPQYKDKVSWTMKDDKLLKLDESEKVLDISDKVFKFMEAKDLFDKEDYEVIVDVNDKEGDNDGTIVKLVVDGEEIKKEEKPKKKKETEQKIDTETKTLTVAGVSTKNKSATFKEEENVWYTVSDNIDVEAFKQDMTKQKGEFTIEKTEKGNDIIVDFTPLEREEKEPVTKNSFSDTSTSTQKSIESQVSLEHSQILAGTLAKTKILDGVDAINAFVDERAKRNYKIMQELKNS